MCYFTFIAAFSKRRHPSIFLGITNEVDLVVGMGLKEDLVLNFVTNHFLPWNSDVTYANRMYFMQQDGIQYVVQVSVSAKRSLQYNIANFMHLFLAFLS